MVGSVRAFWTRVALRRRQRSLIKEKDRLLWSLATLNYRFFIPREIIDAAQKLKKYMNRNFFSDWRIRASNVTGILSNPIKFIMQQEDGGPGLKELFEAIRRAMEEELIRLPKDVKAGLNACIVALADPSRVASLREFHDRACHRMAEIHEDPAYKCLPVKPHYPLKRGSNSLSRSEKKKIPSTNFFGIEDRQKPTRKKAREEPPEPQYEILYE